VKYKEKNSSGTIRQYLSGKYFVSILYEYEIQKLDPVHPSIGIELGHKHFSVDSTGISVGIKVARIRKTQNTRHDFLHMPSTRRFARTKVCLENLK
jgi:transposase